MSAPLAYISHSAVQRMLAMDQPRNRLLRKMYFAENLSRENNNTQVVPLYMQQPKNNFKITFEEPITVGPDDVFKIDVYEGLVHVVVENKDGIGYSQSVRASIEYGEAE